MEDPAALGERLRVSVTDPVSEALDWTGRVLFQPFDAGKWFTLGFCAWLAWIGQSSGGNANWDYPDGDSLGGADAASDWIRANFGLFLGIAVVVFVFVFGLVVLFLWIAVIVSCGIVFGLISVAINDIMVPIMWLRGCSAREAWTTCRSLLSAHAGTFVLYVLLKIGMAIVILLISCLAICVTCCLVAIPYIGVVLLLPLFVFRRSYSIYFLSQFGPEYAPLRPIDATVPESPLPHET